jgi:hypothetical protein
LERDVKRIRDTALQSLRVAGRNVGGSHPVKVILHIGRVKQ